MFFGGVEDDSVVVAPVVYGRLKLLCVVVELVVGRVFGVGAFGGEVVGKEGFVKVVLLYCNGDVGEEDGPTWWSKDGALVDLVV